MERRQALKVTGSAAVLGCFPVGLAGLTRSTTPGRMERRSLGQTGEMLSVLGFGGIVVMNATAEEAAARVRHAIDRGVNYFDVAPSYGNAEERLGPALEPFRKGVFLACKTTQRRRDEAAAELEQSLRRLRTDHFDLYQLHAVTKLDEVEQIFAPGGAMEAVLAARRAGKVRFLGFSAHSVEAALALIDRFDFDTILFPINFRTWTAGNFGPQVLAKAQEKKMGILALKAMALGPIAAGVRKTHEKCWYEPAVTPEQARLGLRFTLSHPVTAAIPPGDETLFALALDVVMPLEPLTPAEAEAVKRKALEGEALFRYPQSA